MNPSHVASLSESFISHLDPDRTRYNPSQKPEPSAGDLDTKEQPPAPVVTTGKTSPPAPAVYIGKTSPIDRTETAKRTRKPEWENVTSRRPDRKAAKTWRIGDA